MSFSGARSVRSRSRRDATLPLLSDVGLTRRPAAVMGRFQEYSVIGRRLPSEREPQVRPTASRFSLTVPAKALPHAHLRSKRRRGQVALLVLHQGASCAGPTV